MFILHYLLCAVVLIQRVVERNFVVGETKLLFTRGCLAHHRLPKGVLELLVPDCLPHHPRAINDRSGGMQAVVHQVLHYRVHVTEVDRLNSSIVSHAPAGESTRVLLF